MGFQSTINVAQGFGVVGEIVFDGPTRAQPGVLKVGTSTAGGADIVVGRAFTIDAADGQFQPGGAGTFGGILANPKALSSIGTSSGGPLAPTLTVPAGEVGEFVTMGEILVALAAAAAIGDGVMFANVTGILSPLAAAATFTGVIAVTTGVLTVSAASAGASIGPGSKITGTGVPAGTYVTAVLSGTGGNGTYQTNIVTAVSSFTNGAATQVAPAGSTVIPTARVKRYANAAAGIAVISLTEA